MADLGGDPSLRAQLVATATGLRRFMEPVWDDWLAAEPWRRGATPSAGACGRTSLFVRDVLRAQGHDAQWSNGVPRRAATSPIGDFGFLAHGRWESHAWVTCQGWIVDITADQFGAPPVIVTPATDPRYAANNLDTADPDAILRRQATATS
nr:lasso peptide biosynthesis protein [Phenylobacterium sp.]